MRFLCLLHIDQSLMGALDAEGLAQMERENEAYDQRLIDNGHYVTALALDPPTSAVLVRNRNGAISSTDGPYAETKEQVGGLIIIEAADLDEARALVEADPMAKYATIEIRPEMGVAWQKRQQRR